MSLSSTPVHCRISKLGSGSDFEAYFIRLGIAAGRARYTKNKVSCVHQLLYPIALYSAEQISSGRRLFHYSCMISSLCLIKSLNSFCVCTQQTERYSSYPVYHSVYETFEIVEKFYDPSFKRLRAVAQVRGGLIFLLADSQLLPLDVNQYADSLRKYTQSIAQLAQKHPEEMETYKVSFGERMLCCLCAPHAASLLTLPPTSVHFIPSTYFQMPCFLLWRTSLWHPETSMSACTLSTEKSKSLFDISYI